MLIDYYLWIKALHIMGVISWMAGLFYLPRLFVYHVDTQIGSDMSETFKTMERRLLRIIMTPAMIISWVCGLLMLVADPAMMGQGWFHAKLLLVVILSGFHGVLAKYMKAFGRDERPAHDHKFYRKINEIPTVLMVVIVTLVIVKPF